MLGGRRPGRRGHDGHPPLSSFVVNDRTPVVVSTQESSAVSLVRTGRGSGMLDDEGVKAHLQDFYDDFNANRECKIPDVWSALYEKYHAPGYMHMRPSGNPISLEGFAELHCSQELTLISATSLIRFDSIQLIAGGTAAVATYTVYQKFTYKGTYNEDRCVMTCVLEEHNGDVKVCHEHRTTGQPIPKQSSGTQIERTTQEIQYKIRWQGSLHLVECTRRVRFGLLRAHDAIK
jgi:hypothetical protein